MPFYEGGSRHKRHVVEVYDLPGLLWGFGATVLSGKLTLRCKSNLGYMFCQPANRFKQLVFLTRRFLGTGIVSVCAANATDRRSVAMAHQRLAC